MNRYARPKLALQVLEQIDDLGLDRDIERRHRLVQDHDVRTERQRAGDRDALALAAGKFRRTAPARCSADSPTATEQFVDPLAVVAAIDAKRFRDDLVDGHPRIQRRVRILKHDLHLAALWAAAAPAAWSVMSSSFSRITPPLGVDQAQDQPAQRGLAATGFAHKSQRLARLRSNEMSRTAPTYPYPSPCGGGFGNPFGARSTSSARDAASDRGAEAAIGRGRSRRDRTRPLHGLLGVVAGNPMMRPDLTKRRQSALGKPPGRSTARNADGTRSRGGRCARSGTCPGIEYSVATLRSSRGRLAISPAV